jgi:hypothetical protein
LHHQAQFEDWRIWRFKTKECTSVSGYFRTRICQ